MHNLYWVGPRLSDLKRIDTLFTGAITLFSDDNLTIETKCLEREIGLKINHNDKAEFDRQKEFYERSVCEVLKKDRNAKFFWYFHPGIISDKKIMKNSLYLNDKNIIAILNNKLHVRKIFSHDIATIPCTQEFLSNISYTLLKSRFPKYNKFIIQEISGSGGEQTFLVSEPRDLVVAQYLKESIVLISPYIEETLPINQHVLIADGSMVTLPPSRQLIKRGNKKNLLFSGSDFSYFDDEILSRINISSRSIAKILAKLGYRGILGIDYLLKDGVPLFVEINPRFQGSTTALNEILLNANLPSVQELHIASFEKTKIPIDSIHKLSSKMITRKQYLEKIEFGGGNNPCQKERKKLSKQVTNETIFLKTDLLSKGFRISKKAFGQIMSNRTKMTVRDGIAGGIDVKLEENVFVNVPLFEKFSQVSPYLLHWNRDGFILEKQTKFLRTIELVPQPTFVGKQTSTGLPMEKIGQLFTDRLGIYAYSGCTHSARRNEGCRFCEVPNQKEFNKSKLDSIGELIDYCSKDIGTNLRHFLVSGGSPDLLDRDHLLDVVSTIRSSSDLAIYLMVEPRIGDGILQDLKGAGVTEIAFNIEIFNRGIANKIMRGKSKNSLEDYYKSFDKSRLIWQKKHSVKTAFIVGLEPLRETLIGVEAALERGVTPILTPFRAVRGTIFENNTSESQEIFYRAWCEGQELAEKYNSTLGPTCIACQNNSLAFPINEQYDYY